MDALIQMAVWLETEINAGRMDDGEPDGQTFSARWVIADTPGAVGVRVFDDSGRVYKIQITEDVTL